MRVEVFKPTKDNWCDSYKIAGYCNGIQNQMLVAVTFHGNIMAYDPKQAPVWRTSVWGNDDGGMEYDCATEAECWNIFLQVIGWDSVDKDALRELGFVIA